MNRRTWKLSSIIIILLVISLSVAGCKSDNGNEEVGVIDDLPNEEENQESDPEEIIDDNTGLIYQDSLEIKYAEHFSVDYYKDGYKIITDASNRKALLVPEGEEVPEMKEEITVIKQPVDTFAVYTTVTPSWFRPIDEVDKIVAVAHEEEKWKLPDMAERVSSGQATFIGSPKAIDYELLQSINPSVNLLSKTSEEEVFPKFDELGLKLLSMGDYLEDDPRGRLEWIKFVAVLLDKENEAEDYFEEELARIDAVEKKFEGITEEKPKVTMAYFSSTKRDFRITNIKGYKVMNMEMAGGSYYPEDLGLDKRGSTPMTAEEFYKIMSETDILIYDSVSGHSIQNLDDMLEAADYLADTKVFQEGRIWGLKRNFWQVGEKVADMTEEFYDIFYTPHGEIEETEYFYLMK